MPDIKAEVYIPKTSYLTPMRLINWISLLSFTIGSYYLTRYIYTSIITEEDSYLQLNLKFIFPLNIVAAILVNAYYTSLYYFELPFIEQYKVNGLQWPWKENPERFNKLIRGAIKTYIINFISANVYILLLGLWTQPTISPKSLPGLPTYLAHLFFSIVCEDFFFYWSHRALHHPYLYPRIHKKHHEFYNTIHISGIHTHWLDFLLSYMLPLLSSVLVLGDRMHVVTLTGLIVFRIHEAHESHCGYEFPWSVFGGIPFATDSAYHNYHHLKNLGNFGSFFRWWDSMFGTNWCYYEERKGKV